MLECVAAILDSTKAGWLWSSASSSSKSSVGLSLDFVPELDVVQRSIIPSSQVYVEKV